MKIISRIDNKFMIFKKQIILIKQIKDAEELLIEKDELINKLSDEIHDYELFYDKDNILQLLQNERDNTNHLHEIIHELRDDVKKLEIENTNLKTEIFKYKN